MNVVLFSGGIASWLTARRVVERGEPTTLLFTDTLTEDEDLYEFLRVAAADVGAPLVRLAEGRDIWQVFRDERFLGNSRADPCSRVLKREMSRRWIEANCVQTETTIHIGYDWTEIHRLDRARRAWAPWRIEAPLTDPPYILRSEMIAEAEARGLPVPRLYRLGLSHNNCGGGCVKAGSGHFAHLLRVFPARYAEWEANEQAIRDELGDVSILRDRADGETKRLTLRDLRLRIEAGLSVDLWDVGGCACFEDTLAEPLP